MSDNKTAELMVEAFIKSGLSTKEAIEHIQEAEKTERKKETETFMYNLFFYYLPAAAVGFLLFVLLVGRL